MASEKQGKGGGTESKRYS